MSRQKAPGYAGLVILALLLGLAFLGADIEMLDSINIAAPVWTIVALAYLLLRLLIDWRADRRGRAAMSALLAAGYIIFALLIFRPLWNGVDSVAATGESLRLVSFNINKDNPEQREVARWIETQSPDFVVLLEARDRAGSVSRLLKKQYPYQYDCRGDGNCSTLILSRTPALAVMPHARGDAENRKAISALTARFSRGGEEIAITAAHMPRPWPMGSQALRLRELAALAAEPSASQIVIGDFNNVPWSFSMNRLAVDMGVRLMSRAVPTWPTGGPAALLPIDNIYGRGCLGLVDLTRGPEIWSDHHPLVMTARTGGCGG
ncbi:endonuclease/exonuclease/phosphatase family protein [Sphingopyxis sp. JAI128]|uniref:endonuclease/exonuclease/phosphatase family protein n=1 Tax=Sphingopyxis sp. JAI128 TaxID=2723066 RepID=UPI00160A3063|nr:endonuclease/exonuclease/phosphatase family protein [Sphingopyxis sp. JAI128]MBB6427182.1 endonuclease/exonuclease/phosphatase (EEP) superfamily protein YafD [Sphingopyxis sp. JAI128]